MTTETRNEAAERLRQAIFDLPDSVPAWQRDQLNVYLSGALHEQVERIRERLASLNWLTASEYDIRVLLDEEKRS